MAIKPTGRKATTVNKTPSKPKKTGKTVGGAQQYVRGNTPDERRDTTFKAMKAAGRKEPYDSALISSLSAAQYANESRTIKSIVGPKKAKTDSTVKMYDRFERENMSRAKKAAAKKKNPKD
jgi:hypothetical protein